MEMEMAEQEDLKRRQLAGERVEKLMLRFLMGLEPCSELKVREVQFIASMARQYAFDEFDPNRPPHAIP